MKLLVKNDFLIIFLDCFDSGLQNHNIVFLCNMFRNILWFSETSKHWKDSEGTLPKHLMLFSQFRALVSLRILKTEEKIKPWKTFDIETECLFLEIV